MSWHNEYGLALAMERLLVLLIGHCCTTTLGKLFTPVCFCQAV